MAFPRVVAGGIVLLLIGCMTLVGIGMVGWMGPTLAHGSNVEHEGGKILAIKGGRDFIFMTDKNQQMEFECREQCRASLGHMQRHVAEKAHTDVYYIQGPGMLLVVDVD